MGEGLVESSLSPLTMHQIFDEVFPQCLAIGMTEEQFWDKDVWLIKAFRKADKIKQERLNEQAWLQGAYVYDAIARLSPILHAFAKEGTKAEPYIEKPYPLTKEKQEEAKEEEAENSQKKACIAFESWAIKHNLRLREQK